MLKASPTSTAHQASARRRPLCTARSPAAHASSMSTIRIVSTPFSRETATKEGNVASTSAAARPARTPNGRETMRYSTTTASTPAIAPGSRRLSGEKPNTFALAACSHSASGGLSIVIRPPGSNDTNRKLCSERSIDFTPAE